MRMGSETEYGIVGGWSLTKAEAVHRQIVAMHPHLPSAKSGIYIENGARIYVDLEKQNEYATPETNSPEELVTCELAGRAIMTEAAAALGLTLLCSNVDPCSHSTWGTHENYECDHIPSLQTLGLLSVHLATRIIFCGSGGLHPLLPGFHPVLSPRACMLVAMHERQGVVRKSLIFSKPYNYGNGHRLHITAGESLLFHSASYLKYATTALLVASLDQKLHLSWPETEASPLQLLQSVNRDFSFSRRYLLKDGRRLTAIEIQQTLLEQVSRHLDALPSWAPIACEQWAAALDDLKPANVDIPARFDWQLWLDLVRTLAEETACSPKRIADYNRSNRHLSGGKSSLNSSHNGPLDFFRGAAIELYIRLHMLGNDSLFERLTSERSIENRMMDITPDRIQHAMKNAPTGRAQLRGKLIQRAKEFPSSFLHWDLLIDQKWHRLLPIPDEETEGWDQQWKNNNLIHGKCTEEHLFHAGQYFDLVLELTPRLLERVDPLSWRDLEILSLSYFRMGIPFDLAQEQLPYLSGGRQTFACIANELLCRIHEGLVPPADKLMPLIQQGDELEASNTDSYHRIAFLQSKAWVLAGIGKLEESFEMLEHLITGEMSGPRPRMLARSHCYASEILLRLDRRMEAYTYARIAHSMHRQRGMVGDLASHSLPLMARLEEDDYLAHGILKEAEYIALKNKNDFVLAKILCIKARRLHQHTDRDKVFTLFETIPSLEACPIAARIKAEWDSWVSGSEQTNQKDYWGIA